MERLDNILRQFGSADWWTRNELMKTLMEYPEQSYLPFLEEALRDHENASLRNAAMDFFRRLDRRALPSLCRLISDQDPDVRLFAANLLGDIGNPGALPQLIQALKDPDVNVKVASAEALGKVGDASAVDALREVLPDEPWVTMAAIKSLGDIGGDSALGMLYDCLEQEEYRGITFEAIEKAGNEHAVRYLTPFVDRDDLRELALKAIVVIAERKRIAMRPEYFMNLIPLLVSLQRSPHADMKRAAFIALTWSGDIRGLPYFIDALKDEDLEEYAISGIMAIGEEAVPEIIDALRDPLRPQRSVLAKILSMLGEHMTLIQFSNDDDPEVRVEVALALEHIGPARGAEILTSMLDDPEDEVSSAARKSLEGIRKTP
jgi:HEAT repeat protein